MRKTARAIYTLEFKEEALRLVTGGQRIAAAARSLGVVEQTLFNWVKLLAVAFVLDRRIGRAGPRVGIPGESPHERSRRIGPRH